MAKKYTRSIWEVTGYLNGVELTAEERHTNALNNQVVYIYTLIDRDESNTLKGFERKVDVDYDNFSVKITLTKEFDALYQKYQTAFADYILSI